MSESFDISASTGSYTVHIEPGSLGRHLDGRHGDVIIADAFFRESLPSSTAAARAVLFYEASETIKSLDAAPALIEQIRHAGANRQTELVAIGGGVIQDLTAFAASIYMRGVPWTYIPTTILGMVDSCIGGKSSINVGPYKNLVGTFHPPQTVIVDPALARTLPLDQQASGIIEAAKICFCRGPESFAAYLASYPHRRHAHRSARYRSSPTACTPRNGSSRSTSSTRTNVSCSTSATPSATPSKAPRNYGISHGIAVGLGILCALTFVRQDAHHTADPYAHTSSVARMEDHLKTIFQEVPELSTHLARLPIDDVMNRFESDKKHKTDSYTLILVEPSAKVVITRVPKSPDSRQRIERAIRSVVESYTS